MTKALDMAAVNYGGVIAEDVMRELYNLSPVDRPFIDSIGSVGGHDLKKEFTDKVLQPASSTNTVYEGQDISALPGGTQGLRYHNLHQHMVKKPEVTNRGRAVETTYGTDEWLQQVMDMQKELKRDEEAAAVSRNEATPEVSDTTGALMAGACSWAIHNTQRGAGGADAVLDGSGASAPAGAPSAPTAGALRAMTETMLKTALRDMYNDGADPSHIMSIPALIEIISDYMFTSSARVATAMTNAPQSNRTGAGAGNGAQAGGITAQGAVNMFVGSFNTVVLTPNRFFHTYQSDGGSADDATELLIFDSNYGAMAYLQDYRNDPVPTPTLSEITAVNVDCCFIPEATHAYTTIADLDHTAAMTQ